MEQIFPDESASDETRVAIDTSERRMKSKLSQFFGKIARPRGTQVPASTLRARSRHALNGHRNTLAPRNIAAQVSVEGMVQAFADIAAALHAMARDLAHPQ